MEVLRLYHNLNLQAKTTGYSFYKSLEYLSDSTGLYGTPVSTQLKFNILIGLILSVSGSSRRVHANGPRMAPSENVKTGWPRVRPPRCYQYPPRITSYRLPCLPAAGTEYPP